MVPVIALSSSVGILFVLTLFGSINVVGGFITMRNFARVPPCAKPKDVLCLSPEVDPTLGLSNPSSYVPFGLFLLSLPGYLSLVSRSVKTKQLDRTFEKSGPMFVVAEEIHRHFSARGFTAARRDDHVVFASMKKPSRSQAAFLTFCGFVTFACLGLVVSTVFPDSDPSTGAWCIGDKAYLLTLLSPLAGVYYWRNAEKQESVRVRLEEEDETEGFVGESSARSPVTVITARGGEEALDALARSLRITLQQR